MTHIEKDAAWLKEQRSKIRREISAIMTIVIDQNISECDDPKYELTAEICMAGNVLNLRVAKGDEDGFVVNESIWSLRDICDPGYFGLNRKAVSEKVNAAIKEIRRLKALASKYAKLNV